MGSEASSVDLFMQIITAASPIGGETADPDVAPKGNIPRGIEITDFNFAGATSASARKRKKRPARFDLDDPLDASAADDDDDEETPDANVFTISKLVDASSPHLMVAFCQTKSLKGMVDPEKLFKSVKVVARKSGGEKVRFLIFVFTNVYVTSYDLKIGSEYPNETITFAFQSIEMRYKPQSASGEWTAQSILGWDFAAVAATSGGGDDDSGGSTGQPSASKASGSRQEIDQRKQDKKPGR